MRSRLRRGRLQLRRAAGAAAGGGCDERGRFAAVRQGAGGRIRHMRGRRHQRHCEIVELVTAGAVPARRVEPGTTIRVMTGAPCRRGADAVVKWEDCRQIDDATIETPAARRHGRRRACSSAEPRFTQGRPCLRPASGWGRSTSRCWPRSDKRKSLPRRDRASACCRPGDELVAAHERVRPRADSQFQRADADGGAGRVRSRAGRPRRGARQCRGPARQDRARASPATCSWSRAASRQASRISCPACWPGSACVSSFTRCG